MSDHPSQLVDGRKICACLDPNSAHGKLAVSVAAHLPDGVLVDVHDFDYGSAHGVIAEYPGGLRRCVRITKGAACPTEIAARLGPSTTSNRELKVL